MHDLSEINDLRQKCTLPHPSLRDKESAAESSSKEKSEEQQLLAFVVDSDDKSSSPVEISDSKATPAPFPFDNFPICT